MCKKDKRYRVILQVAVWNSEHTKVYKYEKQTLLVKAKNPQKAIEKAGTSHAVLMVRLDKQHCQGISMEVTNPQGYPIECYNTLKIKGGL